MLKAKVIYKKDIKTISVCNYNPLAEYGGWGIRYSGKGKAYTVKGNSAIKIMLKNSTKELLLGTQRPREVMKQLMDFNYQIKD